MLVCVISPPFARRSKPWQRPLIMFWSRRPFPARSIASFASAAVYCHSLRRAGQCRRRRRSFDRRTIGGENRQRPSFRTIRVTGPGQKLLEEQGLQIGSIPKSGEIVWLSRASNLHQGAEAVDVTDSMHPSYMDVVER